MISTKEENPSGSEWAERSEGEKGRKGNREKE
jgi:hypothetical protein